MHGLVIFAFAVVILWTLRCTEIYGDAKTLQRLVRDGVLFVKRGAHFARGVRARASHDRTRIGWAPVVAIQVINTLAGALGIVVIVSLGAPHREPPLRPAAWHSSAMGRCSCSRVTSRYTLSTVCMLASLVCGLDALAGRRGLVAAFGLWTLSCMFHLSGIVFLPAMIWLAYHAGVRRPGAGLALGLRLAAVTVLPAVVLVIVMRAVGFEGADEPGMGGGDGSMFVPLFELSGMTRYLMFRPAHLLAIANEQLLVAPLGISIVVVGTIVALRRGQWRTWQTADAPGVPFVAQLYLGLVATGFLALTVIWNPDFGPLQDWDLFGPVGFYLGVSGIALLVRHLGDQPQRLTALLWFVAIVNLSRALPFVLYNAGL